MNSNSIIHFTILFVNLILQQASFAQSQIINNSNIISRVNPAYDNITARLGGMNIKRKYYFEYLNENIVSPTFKSYSNFINFEKRLRRKNLEKIDNLSFNFNVLKQNNVFNNDFSEFSNTKLNLVINFLELRYEISLNQFKNEK